MNRGLLATIGLPLLALCSMPSLGFGQAAPATRVTQPKAAAPAPIPPTEAVLETPLGEIVIRLLPALAPRHVRHFVKTAQSGGYTGTTFHRIIRAGIIQGGDPLSKDPAKSKLYGTGGLGLLTAEFSDRAFLRGVVAAVLRPRDPSSAGNQFFIVLTEQAALKGQYTIFGEVVSGIEIADKIGETPVEGDRATTRVEIRRITLRAPAAAAP